MLRCDVEYQQKAGFKERDPIALNVSMPCLSKQETGGKHWLGMERLQG